MATNIPPHNLREVVDAVIYLIEHRERDARSQVQGRCCGSSRGPISRPAASSSAARASSRPTGPAAARSPSARRPRSRRRRKGERTSIVVTEIPYQVNKAKLIEKIAELVRDKTIEGIADLRDESDREGCASSST